MMPWQESRPWLWQPSGFKSAPGLPIFYLRHPALAGASAVAIDELSDGRLILGLGVSHRPLLDALDIEMKEARTYFREYIGTVKKVMAGGPPKEGMSLQFSTSCA